MKPSLYENSIKPTIEPTLEPSFEQSSELFVEPTLEPTSLNEKVTEASISSINPNKFNFIFSIIYILFFILCLILILVSGYYCCLYCCNKPIMFKKKKDNEIANNKTIENNDQFDLFYNIYPDQNHINYMNHQIMYSKYKKNQLIYNPSPYKVHSYRGYKETYEFSNPDIDVIKDKNMNV